MNAKSITQKLNKKYPGKFIIENKIEGVITEILCETKPSSEHPKYSEAIAIIDESQPHHHKVTTETYKIISGRLRLFVDGEEIAMVAGEEYSIESNKIHWAIGDETWVLVKSTPGWPKEDHHLAETTSN